jgi:hypothetical protein
LADFSLAELLIPIDPEIQIIWTMLTLSCGKKGEGVGTQNFTTIFIALVETITTGFKISALKRKNATDDFIDEWSGV